jgi:hypothetical protein
MLRRKPRLQPLPDALRRGPSINANKCLICLYTRERPWEKPKASFETSRVRSGRDTLRRGPFINANKCLICLSTRERPWEKPKASFETSRVRSGRDALPRDSAWHVYQPEQMPYACTRVSGHGRSRKRASRRAASDLVGTRSRAIRRGARERVPTIASVSNVKIRPSRPGYFETSRVGSRGSASLQLLTSSSRDSCN